MSKPSRSPYIYIRHVTMFIKRFLGLGEQVGKRRAAGLTIRRMRI